MLRKLVKIAALLALVWVACVAGLYWAMRQPPDRFGAFMKRLPRPAMLVLPFETLWMRARAGAVGPGDPAPDFELTTVDHKTTVRLSRHRGERPVVLVFGSYT